MVPNKILVKKRRIQFDEEESAGDIESDSAQGSPIYAESGDSASHESEDEIAYLVCYILVLLGFFYAQ